MFFPNYYLSACEGLRVLFSDTLTEAFYATDIRLIFDTDQVYPVRSRFQ